MKILDQAPRNKRSRIGEINVRYLMLLILFGGGGGFGCFLVSKMRFPAFISKQNGSCCHARLETSRD